MIPILYNSNETNFNNYGIGALTDCLSCVVTEERNGIYECEFSYPITGIHYSEISPDRIIKAKASEYADNQLFRIYRSSKPINGIVKFYCQHISYDLNTNIVNPFKAEGVNTVTAITRVLENCCYPHNFVAASDKATISTIDIKVPTPARACLGGIDGSILDNFGGEYEFDNFTVKLYDNRGVDSGVTILYGKNLESITADTSLQSTYTAVYPYAIDNDNNTTTLTEKVIETSSINNYGEPKVLALDLSDKFTEEEITEQKIRDYANAYIARNHIEDVYQNIEISFVQLWQTEEYKNIAPLERVGLCDTVTVKYPALGVSVKAKVIKTVYDTIAEKYNKIELGKARSQFGDSLIQGEKELKQSIIHNKSAMQKAIETATALITGQSGGYIIFRNFTDIFDAQGHKIETKTLPDGQPAEMLIMDKPDVAQATHVWRYNLSGWGYSSTGINGPYRLAATSNGAIVADFITTGTLNAGLIKAGIIEDENQKNYWNMYTGEFKFSDGFRDAMKYENGTMSINASIINTGRLNAARITAGALQDTQGVNYWNMETGEFRLSANTKVGTSSSNQTLSNYVNSAASGTLTQQNVFNALTNNGALQGIYMSGGNLYINGSYIQAGTINANYIKAGTLSDVQGNTSFDLSNGKLSFELDNAGGTAGETEIGRSGLTMTSPPFSSVLPQRESSLKAGFLSLESYSNNSTQNSLTLSYNGFTHNSNSGKSIFIAPLDESLQFGDSNDNSNHGGTFIKRDVLRVGGNIIKYDSSSTLKNQVWTDRLDATKVEGDTIEITGNSPKLTVDGYDLTLQTLYIGGNNYKVLACLA